MKIRSRPKQHSFLRYLEQGMSEIEAARAAGYADSFIRNGSYKKSVHVQQEMARIEEENRRALKIERQDVLEGLQYAIVQAVAGGDPQSQISAWREIAKICGFYAPEKKDINVRLTEDEALRSLRSLPTADLVERMQHNPITITDAEYKSIEEKTDEGSETEEGSGEEPENVQAVQE